MKNNLLSKFTVSYTALFLVISLLSCSSSPHSFEENSTNCRSISSTATKNRCARLFNDHYTTDKNLPKEVEKKYNTPTCYVFRFSRESLARLKEVYKTAEVPDFIVNIAKGTDLSISSIQQAAPKLVEWTSDGKTVLIPNAPRYHKPKDIISRVRKGSLGGLKNSKNGITLSTWFIHPTLRSSGKSPIIKSLGTKSEPYIASPLDLNTSHIGQLKKLEQRIWRHLKENYNVNKNDSVRIYFHFPYALKTATFHLHIRVNQPTHGLEKAKSYSLRQTIEHLESGGKIEDLILRRQEELGGTYANKGGAENFLEVQGISTVQQVENPFFRP